MVFAWDTTTGVAKTGDAANITAYVSKDYGAVTILGDTAAAEMDAVNAKGYYLFDAAQAETNADVLMVSAKSATANIAVIGAPAVIYTRPTTGFLAPATLGRTLVVDAAGLADANMVKCGPTGAGTAQTAKDIGAAVPASAPGAANGLQICGSNAASTYASVTCTGSLTVSDGLLVSRSSVNQSALVLTGNGTGHGLLTTSGSGITGDGLRAVAASTNGNGITGVKTGSGSDLNVTVTPLTLAKTTNITGFNDIAATAVVSSGAITTSGGAVSTVTNTTQLNGAATVVLTDASLVTAKLGTFALAKGTNITGFNDIAATSIVSAGAITTSAGKVSGVILTDTCTTNTDMRGTDSAALASVVTMAAINAEVVDALNTDTYAEPAQGAPAATASLVSKLGYLYKAWRNKSTQTATQYTLYADNTITTDQKSTDADDGTTFTKGEVGTGA